MIAGMESQRTRDSVRDRRIKRVVELLPPATLLDELPLGDERAAAVVRGREEVAAVLDRDDDRLLVVAGPCSVHDPEARSTTPIASPRVAADLGDDLLVAMRVYFEKPRTTVGWKGLINDPHLDGSGDVNSGLRIARELLLDVLDVGPLGRLRVPRSDHSAVHRRHRRLGGDRRADEREPDPPPARLRALDADRVQEPNRRQRAGRGRRGPRRGRPARVRGHRRRGGPGDPLHGGKPRWPRDPARRRRWAELRRRRRSRARSSCFARRACPSGW